MDACVAHNWEIFVNYKEEEGGGGGFINQQPQKQATKWLPHYVISKIRCNIIKHLMRLF